MNCKHINMTHKQPSIFDPCGLVVAHCEDCGADFSELMAETTKPAPVEGGQ